MAKKLKTHRGAAKRFRLTGKGKIKRWKAFHSHLATGKPPKRKRHLRKPTIVSRADMSKVRKALGV